MNRYKMISLIQRISNLFNFIIQIQEQLNKKNKTKQQNKLSNNIKMNKNEYKQKVNKIIQQMKQLIDINEQNQKLNKQLNQKLKEKQAQIKQLKDSINIKDLIIKELNNNIELLTQQNKQKQTKVINKDQIRQQKFNRKDKLKQFIDNKMSDFVKKLGNGQVDLSVLNQIQQCRIFNKYYQMYQLSLSQSSIQPIILQKQQNNNQKDKNSFKNSPEVTQINLNLTHSNQAQKYSIQQEQEYQISKNNIPSKFNQKSYKQNLKNNIRELLQKAQRLTTKKFNYQIKPFINKQISYFKQQKQREQPIKQQHQQKQQKPLVNKKPPIQQSELGQNLYLVEFKPNITELKFIYYQQQEQFKKKNDKRFDYYDLSIIQSLQIYKLNLTSPILSHLVKLQWNNLRSLILTKNNIVDITPIKQLNIKQFQQLDVSFNPLNTNSAVFLSTSPFPQLAYYGVSFKQGKNRQYWEIMLRNQMKNYPKLQYIQIRCAEQLDDGIKNHISQTINLLSHKDRIIISYQNNNKPKSQINKEYKQWEKKVNYKKTKMIKKMNKTNKDKKQQRKRR